MACLFCFVRLEVSLAEGDAERAAVAASGFCWECWQVAAAGAREAAAGAEAASAVVRVMAEAGGSEDLEAAVAEAEGPQEAGSVGRKGRI